MQRQYSELCRGTGKWEVDGRPVGPGALLEAWPGGRRPLDVIGESIVNGASLAEQAWLLENVRGFQEFTAKEVLLDVYRVLDGKLPQPADAYS